MWIEAMIAISVTGVMICLLRAIDRGRRYRELQKLRHAERVSRP